MILEKKKVKSKRSQEEMIGFVLIIVLVVVIALVFLAIGIRKKNEIKQDKDIANFLHSALLYTSDCYESPDRVYDLRDLIKACYYNKNCLDERKSCESLDSTVNEILDKSFNFGEESVEKAYVFKIHQEGNSLLSLNFGNETKKSRIGDSPIYVDGSNIYVEMTIFY